MLMNRVYDQLKKKYPKILNMDNNYNNTEISLNNNVEPYNMNHK
jgi:hypothetical protein